MIQFVIQFVNGPACGTTLDLKRAPLLLRVVIGPKGVDALDQLDDEPQADEQIHVYRLVGNVGRGIACSRGRRGGGCMSYLVARYVLHDPQPTDAAARDRESWRTWAQAQVQSLAPANVAETGDASGRAVE